MMFRSNKKYRPAAFLFTLVMNLLLTAQGFSMPSQEAWKKDIEGIANSLQELKTEIRTINSEVDKKSGNMSFKLDTMNAAQDNMIAAQDKMIAAQKEVIGRKADKVDVMLLQRDVENIKKELKGKRDR